MAEHAGFVELAFTRLPEQEMIENSATFLNKHKARSSVRDFSSEPVPRDIIANAILTAGSAPSGAMAVNHGGITVYHSCHTACP